MKNKTVLINSVSKKSVDVWGDDPAGWTIFSGEGSTTTEAEYFKLIPTLYRAVQLRAYGVSTMPFQIRKGSGDKPYDTSADWQNKVNFLPNPAVILQLIEAALVMAGRCYLFRDRNQAMTKLLRYHLPTSVTPAINKVTGEIEYFERNVNGVPKKFKPEDYVYFWLPDPYVEIGPPINYPAQAAAHACGVLYNLDVFAEGFFERGAIKATLLTVTGMPDEAERAKLEDFWNRFIGGVKNIFRAKIFNAEAVKPVIIGEGMKELENVAIEANKREDIAVALGIPMSILFANAANYATSQQDELNFLTKTIIPDCEFIASILNEQIFEPLGLYWEFLPDTLDAMQEDETQRAGALGQLTSAGIPLLMAMDILGYELTKEQRAELEQAVEDKQQRAEELAGQMAEKPSTDQTSQEEEQDEEEPENETFKAEMLKWQRKALNALKRGKPANVDFVTTVIPANTSEVIVAALGKAQTAEDVKAAFVFTATEKPVFSDGIMALAAELRRANNLLEREEE